MYEPGSERVARARDRDPGEPRASPGIEPFTRALSAVRRGADVPATEDLYGWLVGSWELDVRHYRGIDVTDRGMLGEVHAAWVLEGRAMQDVWIMPRRSERAAKLDTAMNMYATTLRLWDTTLQAWRIQWSNPARNHYEQQVGQRSGTDIVQLGHRPDGTATRWKFTDITADSFHWLGAALQLDGTTWRLEAEFLAKRVDSRKIANNVLGDVHQIEQRDIR